MDILKVKEKDMLVISFAEYENGNIGINDMQLVSRDQIHKVAQRFAQYSNKVSLYELNKVGEFKVTPAKVEMANVIKEEPVPCSKTSGEWS